MNNLKLFHVNVSQEWSTEAEAYVLATSKNEAEVIAEKNINLDPYDYVDGFMDVKVCESSFPISGNKDYLYFFAPNSRGQYEYVDYETFMTRISSEDIEKMRIEKIEKNNGQLPLPLNQ
jgi:hypothetical protein